MLTTESWGHEWLKGETKSGSCQSVATEENF